MSILYYCRACQDVIGVEPVGLSLSRVFSGNFDSTVLVDCPGKGNHPKPKRIERTKLFGLVKQVVLEYSETRTMSSWEEYVGPSNKFCLWFAIVFGTTRYPIGCYAGLTVNGKWAWWDLETGFYGDGVHELMHLRSGTT